MLITLTDVSRGKPYSLNQSIKSCKQIGIRTIFMLVGWYNIYKEQSWRWAREDTPNNSTEVKIQPGLYSFSDLAEILTCQVEGFTITVNRTNGLINMIIPASYQVCLPEAIRYLLGLEDSRRAAVKDWKIKSWKHWKKLSYDLVSSLYYECGFEFRYFVTYTGLCTCFTLLVEIDGNGLWWKGLILERLRCKLRLVQGSTFMRSC